MRPLQPLVEIFRQLGGAGRALPSRHKTHPASTFGGPRLVRRPLGIIHVTDVYVVFRLRRHKLWLSRAPGYLGTRDEKSGLESGLTQRTPPDGIRTGIPRRTPAWQPERSLCGTGQGSDRV